MNDELIYEYVKGQGWVIHPEKFYLVNKNGRKIVVEFRKPLPHEHFFWGYGPNRERDAFPARDLEHASNYGPEEFHTGADGWVDNLKGFPVVVNYDV